jgi:hypothetical protein
MRKRVYIAGPISKGDLAANVNAATDAFHALLHLGFAPLCPHWSVFSGGTYHPTPTDKPFAFAEALPLATTHDDWLDSDLPWVAVADAVLRLEGDSGGADREVAEAEARGIPVFRSVTEVKAWAAKEVLLPEGWASIFTGPKDPITLRVYRHSTPAYPPALRPSHSVDAFEKLGVCVDPHHKAAACFTCGGDRAKGIKGVGKDEPIAINAAGGKQSASPFRCDLLPPHATLAVAEVLAHGAAKYGANNWHVIPVEDHLNHALVHIFADRAGDASDDHLEHAACRIMMALDQKRSGRAAV